MKKITEFRNEYYFLSNFYPCNINYKGYEFKNSEAAFQAMKCPIRAKEFSNLSGAEAKRLGRYVNLRNDWYYVKENIMYEIVKAKFTQNNYLKEKLLNTNEDELIEGNTWGDREWGMCNGYGQNKLGKILMKVRNELKN